MKFSNTSKCQVLARGTRIIYHVNINYQGYHGVGRQVSGTCDLPLSKKHVKCTFRVQPDESNGKDCGSTSLM